MFKYQQEWAQRDLRFFDKLPKSLRRALDDANFKFVAEEYYDDWKSGCRTLKSLIAEVKRLSAKESKRRDDLKAQGKIPNDL